MGCDAMGDPEPSGWNGGNCLPTDLLRPILGNAIPAQPFAKRPEEEPTKFGYWCDRLECYLTWRHVGFAPKFAWFQ